MHPYGEVMKRLVPYIAVAAFAAALAGCNKGPGTAYNNSGASATPGSSTVTSTTAPSDTSSPATTTTAAAPSTDTSSVAANPIADTATTGKVQAAIAVEPALKNAAISVKTDGGIVVLTGTAKSQDQIAMATSLAQRQDGVTRVDNQVVVQ
jgi:hyperosmotically inducible protein